jgi:hypothetical protein
MIARTILLLVIIALIPFAVAADEYSGTPVGAAAWLGAGAIVINGSVAVANGLSLASGMSSRKNGMFGLVLGSTTMAVSALGLVVADDSESRAFPLVLGAAGLASAVTGMLSLKFAGPGGEQVSLTPLVNPFGSEDSAKAGFQLKIRF